MLNISEKCQSSFTGICFLFLRKLLVKNAGSRTIIYFSMEAHTYNTKFSNKMLYYILVQCPQRIFHVCVCVLPYAKLPV